jgi:hypothetical protein
MGKSLDGVRAKIARTDNHIREIDGHLRPLAQEATAAIRPVDTFHDGMPRRVYRIGHVPAVSADCAALVGDALYNLRSALDHLAAQLAFREGVTPETLSDDAYFPIRSKRLDSNGRKISYDIPGVNDKEVKAKLLEVQPFENEERYGHALWNQALWLINKLGNIDKHRLLLVMVHRIEFEGPNFPWWEGDGVANVQMKLGALKSGDDVAVFDFKAMPDESFDPHISLSVSLGEGPAGYWPQTHSVTELLKGLREYVTGDLLNWQFLRFFPGEAPFDAVRYPPPGR